MAADLLVNTIEQIIVGTLTIFVLHAVEALLNSHHTQHFSVSCLISHEVLLLTAPDITHLHCNILNQATLLLSMMKSLSTD